MSMYEYQMAECSNCGNEEKIKIWQSVNVTIDKEEKERILNNTFFKHKCSKCGEEAYIEYEMLYHDMDKKMMVYLIHDENEEYKEWVGKFLDSEMAGTIIHGDYILRLVNNQNELKEKIMIRDLNLDDRIIEIMKLCYRYEIEESNPRLKITETYLNYYNNKYMIVFFLEDGRTMESIINKEFYNGLEKEYSGVLDKCDSEGFEEVNLKWAESFLELNLKL